MPRTPARPPAELTQEDITAFWRDGVICVRGLYSQEWRERLADGLEAAASGYGAGLGRMGTDGDYSESYAWLTIDTIRDFVLDAPSAWIAQQIFGSKAVNFYYDQIFIKNKLSRNPTPWHHDYTFWPIVGDQILSLWTSLDPVDAQSSALEFIAGSHRWPQRYQAIGADGRDLSTDKGLTKMPDIDGNRERHTILSWEVQPGDALVFHALTLHGARGNASADTRRRAITTRWCGDDVTYTAERGIPMPYPHGLGNGDRLGGSFFPRILPAIDEEALSQRMSGPVGPDEAILAQNLQDFVKANAEAARTMVAAD